MAIHCLHRNGTLGVSTQVIMRVEMSSDSLVLSLAVSKAPLAASPHKEEIASASSKETLLKFLRRRHSRYLAKLKKESEQMQSQCSGFQSFASNDCRSQREAIAAAKHVNPDSLNASFKSGGFEGDAQRFAERVVQKAKQRVVRKLKYRKQRHLCRQQRQADQLSSYPHPGTDDAGSSPQRPIHNRLPSLHSSESMKSSPSNLSTPVKSHSPSKPVISPLVKAVRAKQESVAATPSIMASRACIHSSSKRLSTFFSSSGDTSSNTNVSSCRRRLVFLSESCSGRNSHFQAPNASPVLEHSQPLSCTKPLYSYKGQQMLKGRLEQMVAQEFDKMAKDAEKLDQERAKRKQGELLARKAQQRAEIYALNRAMTLLEEKNFQQFLSGKV